MARKRKEKWKALPHMVGEDRMFVEDQDGDIMAVIPYYGSTRSEVARLAKRIAMLPDLERALVRLEQNTRLGTLTPEEERLVAKIERLTKTE